MFTDLTSIESEIELFKSNMNSVDGLMSAVKEICSKMDNQISQGEQYIKRLEKLQELTSDRLNELTATQENISNNQMRNINTAIKEQANNLMEIKSKFERSIQDVIQANMNHSQEMKGNIDHSLEQLNDSTNTITQMMRSEFSDQKEIYSKALISLTNQMNVFIKYQNSSSEYTNTQLAKLSYEINELKQAASAIDNKIKIFGMMTVAGIFILGILFVLL